MSYTGFIYMVVIHTASRHSNELRIVKHILAMNEMVFKLVEARVKK